MNRLRNWYSAQPSLGQWGAGCVVVIAVVVLCLYGLGVGSFVLRPNLIATPVAATVILEIPTTVHPVPPTAVAAPPTLNLPGSTLEPTPTQAPIPTRPPTDTPDPNATPTVETTETVTP